LEKNIFIYLSLDCVCNAHRMGRLIWTWTIELVLHKENNILGLESKWEVTIWKSSRYPIAALVSAFNACKNLKSKIQIILCALQFAFHLNKQIFRDLRRCHGDLNKNRNLFRAILQGSFTWTRSFLLSNFSDGYVTKTAGTKFITITGHLFCSWPLWTKV